MSAPSRTGEQRVTVEIPDAWWRFLRSGEPAGARAPVGADGSDVPVELVARLEFVDERRVAIDVALTERPPDGTARKSLVQLLTPRERGVVSLIASGRETSEIARALYISPATVRTHVRNAMKKLGARTRAQLVAMAMAGPESLELDGVLDGAEAEPA